MDFNCESLWEKMTGKPYSGKPNVRFDEGKLEIGYGQASEALPIERGRNRYADLMHYACFLLYPNGPFGKRSLH
jgi:hypothetical protein